MNTSVSIIGYGRLGKLFHKSLEKEGYDNISILRKEDEILLLNDLILITVPDGNIADVINEINSSGLKLKGKTIAHCSGVRGLGVFNGLKAKKLKVGCIHPLMAITESANSFQGITFDVCGDEKFTDQISSLIQDLGAEMLIVEEDQKAKLHVAAVLTSNYLITLSAMAQDVFKDDNLDSNELKKALIPLLQSAINNLDSQTPQEALTGPIIRSDVDTIKKHLEILESNLELKSAYNSLGKETVRLLGTELSDDVKLSLNSLFNEA